MGGGGSVPSAPKFQSSQYMFGDEVKSSTTKNKKTNTVTTKFNPTGQEKQTYNYIQNQLPNLYQAATTPQDFTNYVNTYTQNQKDAVNRDYQDQLRLLKAGLISSGQMKDSVALDKLKPLSDSYLQSMQDIEANAPTYANQLRNNDLAYNSSILENAVNGLNNFYNTGNTFNTNATNLSQMANNVANQQFQNQMAAYQLQQQAKQQNMANIANMAKTTVAVGAAPFTGGASLGLML